ncbi:nitric oxide-sensing protein NosP [Halomonas halocynthiae]|uniref:nitric oxide-sensing protein NosP n=1 Tax=Halomonas halocynthiae TaxID=176290 RepID=UPI000406A418|nr:nitric oxide-sensing protein NosP [Halomonas halocynthiae]
MMTVPGDVGIASPDIQWPHAASSACKNPDEAAAELALALKHPDLSFVLFFCSADYPLEALGVALNSAFSNVRLAGCTTAGEITPLGYGRGCIVAIGFNYQDFSVSCARIENLERFTLPCAQQLVDGLLADCRSQAPSRVDRRFALTLLDGLSSSEEQVLAALEAALGGIPNFGGSAADDNRLTDTYVFADGGFHRASAVVLVVSTPLPFEVFTTHHLRPRQQKLVVTRVDVEQRRVLELNAMPAAEAYSQLVGIAPSQLDERVFAQHPLAVRIGDQHYVRSIQRADEEGGLHFYCAVENGIVLTVMQAAPMLDQLSELLVDLDARLGPLSLILGCDCFLRRLELEDEGLIAPASRVLSEAGVVGFNTYGEQHQGMHINQTFTGVAIGAAARLTST